MDRTPSPSPWTEGDNIPWNDPEFSERMLVEHLSQEHDLGSREAESIDEHVDWIVSTVLEGRPRKVLMGGTLLAPVTENVAVLQNLFLGVIHTPSFPVPCCVPEGAGRWRTT